jgi:hypothetical protein
MVSQSRRSRAPPGHPRRGAARRPRRSPRGDGSRSSRGRENRRRARQQPSQRDLRRRGAVPACHLGERPAAARERRAPGQRVRRERPPRQERGGLRRAAVDQRLGVGVAAGDAVAVLHRGDRHQGARLVELHRRDVAQTDVAGLALAAELGERADRVGERHLRVGPVQLVEVDPVQPQPPQARLARRPQVLGPAVGVDAGGRGAGLHDAALGRDDEAQRVRVQSLRSAPPTRRGRRRPPCRSARRRARPPGAGRRAQHPGPPVTPSCPAGPRPAWHRSRCAAPAGRRRGRNGRRSLGCRSWSALSHTMLDDHRPGTQLGFGQSLAWRFRAPLGRSPHESRRRERPHAWSR